MSIQILSPYTFFTTRNGVALNEGYVYIGEPNQDPETNPVACYFDADLTIPATQPLRTENGYIVNSGSPASVYTEEPYSIRVRAKNATQVFYVARVTSALIELSGPTGSSLVGFIQAGTGAVARTVQGKLREAVSVTDFGADPTGVNDSYDAFVAAITAHDAVHIPNGTYRLDQCWDIVSSGSHRKRVTMDGAKLIRLSAYSASTDPVLRLLNNYSKFDGGGGSIETQNNSPEGVVALGHADTTTSNYNGLYWAFGNVDIRAKDFSSLLPGAPGETDGVGVYIPSSAPVFGSSAANYFGSIYKVRVFDATTAWWLTDQVNAHTFTDCSVDFFWYYGWRFNGAYGNTVYGGFVNGAYRDGAYADFFGNRLQPTAPYAASHQSLDNQFYGQTIELYTSSNVGVYIEAGADGLDSVRNYVNFCWNSLGLSFQDNTDGQQNMLCDNSLDFTVPYNFTMPATASGGRGLLRVGTVAYSSNHAIARGPGSGTATLVVENTNTASAAAYVMDVRWNTPTIGFNGAIISTYHVPTAATRFQVLDSGNVQNTNNSYGAISDIKFKNLIGRCESQWDDVKFLAGSLTKYTLKNDPENRVQLGLVAQEVEERCPGLVYATPDTERIEVQREGVTEYVQRPTGEESKGVSYSVVQLKALKALGEALERIEGLESRIAELSDARIQPTT